MQFNLIEGFYGHYWLPKQRLALIPFLARLGFSGYCYAPKSDFTLRKHLRLAFDEIQLAHFNELAELARQHQICFSVALSPIYDHQLPLGNALKNKIKQLQQLDINIVLLLDDMKVEADHFALEQARFANEVRQYIDQQQLFFCPTFYSSDPCLEKFFGARPDNYWQTLGAELDTKIDVFWTGEKVVSSTYTRSNIEMIAELIQRNPVIWDNSAVTDGKSSSDFLPLSRRVDFSSISSIVSSVWFNPMNAFALMKLQLGFQMQSQATNFSDYLSAHYAKLAQSLLPNLSLFEVDGLSKLSSAQKKQLLSVFSGQTDEEDAIRDWLNGKFIFDPACLT